MAACTPAGCRRCLLVEDPGGARLAVMYHHDYGGVARVPGSDLALAIVVRDDNSGPHTPQEIAKIYADLKERNSPS